MHQSIQPMDPHQGSHDEDQGEEERGLMSFTKQEGTDEYSYSCAQETGDYPQAQTGHQKNGRKD